MRTRVAPSPSDVTHHVVLDMEDELSAISRPMKPEDIIRASAERLGIQAEAIRKWGERGRVPYRWRLPILDDCKRRRLNVDPAWFDRFGRQNSTEAA